MFKFRKSNTKPEVPVIKMLTTSASLSIGDALVLKSGAAAKAGATETPQYICAGKVEDGEVPAYLVTPGMEFDTTFSAAATSIKEGDRVTLGTDSATVTATTTSGVALVLKKHSDGASGTGVTVTF